MSDEARVVTGLVAHGGYSGGREPIVLVQQLEVIIRASFEPALPGRSIKRERLSGRVAPGPEGMESIAGL